MGYGTDTRVHRECAEGQHPKPKGTKSDPTGKPSTKLSLTQNNTGSVVVFLFVFFIAALIWGEGRQRNYTSA